MNTSTSPSRHDRRCEPRTAVGHPVKFQCILTGRYMQGIVRNISATGILAEVAQPSLLVQGQRMRIAIIQNQHAVLLRQDDMIHATVVRSLGLGGRQHVAMAFETRQDINITAGLAASA